MSKYILTPRTVFLSIIYVLIAFVMLNILDVGLDWFLNTVVFAILNWFNRLSFIIKIVVLFLGLGVFIGFLSLVGTFTTLLGGLIFNKLPNNNFTSITSFVLAICNAIWFIVRMWKIPDQYNFWVVCELILLSVFIWSLSSIVLPMKEQIKNVS